MEKFVTRLAPGTRSLTAPTGSGCARRLLILVDGQRSVGSRGLTGDPGSRGPSENLRMPVSSLHVRQAGATAERRATRAAGDVGAAGFAGEHRADSAQIWRR